MKDIVLYCKSYHRDVQRAKRLAESIRQFNSVDLPFYLSCPSADLSLFRDVIGNDGIIFIADEEVIAANPAINLGDLTALAGGLSQQIVKSEFARITCVSIRMPILSAASARMISLRPADIPTRS